jgi:hypothetical protein
MATKKKTNGIRIGDYLYITSIYYGGGEPTIMVSASDGKPGGTTVNLFIDKELFFENSFESVLVALENHSAKLAASLSKV